MIEYSSIMSKSNIIYSDDLPYDIRINKSNTINDLKSDTDIICFVLKELINIDKLRIIMDIIDSSKNSTKGIGRNSIISILKNYDIEITESSLKTIFNHLKSYDLISIGKTKQGTKLTSKGEELLKLIQSKYNRA